MTNVFSFPVVPRPALKFSNLVRLFTAGLLFITAPKAWAVESYLIPSVAGTQMVMGNPSGATNDIGNANNYLMSKDEYAMSYNKSHATPNWVSWRLVSADVGSSGRTDNWAADTTLPTGWYRVGPNDYSSSTYDRGHNCPSGDRTLSKTINYATFLMSNMVPQTPDNNQGPWADLETYCRTLASRKNTLYIISVPNTYSRVTINSGKIYVPKFMSKVIVVLPEGNSDSAQNVTSSTRVICVDMPNIAGIRSEDWFKYRISVDQLEAYTGYNFLSEVPETIQAAIESNPDTLPTN